MPESREIGLELSGTVTQFDEYVALGEITDGEGRIWPFHCVSIEDGTRTITVGQRVHFQTAWRVARVEAVAITPQ